MILHKHLLVNAKVNEPIRSEEEGKRFLIDLVGRIDMKIIQGPFASYVEAVGNQGLTAMVMIETSHIAFHIWDEPSPALLQFDLYTCGKLDRDEVIKALKDTFNIENLEYIQFDRENGFVVEASGVIRGDE